MLIHLYKLANLLDKLGHMEAADEIDNYLSKMAHEKHIPPHPPTCVETNTHAGWEKYHDWLKKYEWEKLPLSGIQKLPDNKVLEMRNCPLCKSSLFVPA